MSGHSVRSELAETLKAASNRKVRISLELRSNRYSGVGDALTLATARERRHLTAPWRHAGPRRSQYGPRARRAHRAPWRHPHVSEQHLGAYIPELGYPFDRRGFLECELVDHVLAHVARRLTYKALTHAKTEGREDPNA